MFDSSPQPSPRSARRGRIILWDVNPGLCPLARPDPGLLSFAPTGLSVSCFASALRDDHSATRQNHLANASTSGNCRTSATNFASNGDTLSFRQMRASGNGRFKSVTGSTTTLSEQRQRVRFATVMASVRLALNLDKTFQIQVVQEFLNRNGLAAQLDPGSTAGSSK